MRRASRWLGWIGDAFASSSDLGIVAFIAAIVGGLPAIAIYISSWAQLLAGVLLIVIIPLLPIATACGLIAACSPKYSRVVPVAALVIVALAAGPYALLCVFGR